ncbi:MAG: hypothetical protein H0V44_16070 [Planctomycetes bacterium]|nr:hypothetical protein [Planctomycetota bacterium]
MRRVRQLAPWAASAALITGLVAWNASRFDPDAFAIRTKDLSFLPTPAMARMLSLGQAGAVSKLRWIDSFAYFELQLERRDDHVAGGGKGFDRLYDILTTLDPHYEPFYLHAAFNIGAVMNRHDKALGFVLRGLLSLPHATALWRQAAVELHTTYRYEELHPELMTAFLQQWADAELTQNDKRVVWEWSLAMSRRSYRGLEQLPYWQEQLAHLEPGSTSATYVEQAMREQLVRFCLAELQALSDSYRTRHGEAPARLEQLLEPAGLADRYPIAIPGLAPFKMLDRRIALRCDPYGFPFELAHGQIISPGFERYKANRRLSGTNNQLASIASASGRWPQTVDAARSAGVTLPTLPPGGSYTLDDQTLEIAWTDPPEAPWPLGRR